MSEPFPSFGQSYRAMFTAVLTFSSSGIAGLILIATKETAASIHFAFWYKIGIVSFLLSIIICISSNFWGLYHEMFEGASTKGLHQRQINKFRFLFICAALMPFIIGSIAFALVALSLI